MKPLASADRYVLVVRVEEGVLVAPEEALVDVHAAAVLAEERLRHEGGVAAVLVRDLLHDRAVGHDVVGHLQAVGEAHVDLVLGRPDLVVRVLDLDAHLLERHHRVAPEVARLVERGEVEVPALVEHLGAVGAPEVEVLELGPEVEVVVAHVLGPLERAPHDVARVALVGLAARHADVAEHARHRAFLRAIGEDRERVRVGHGDHVRLLDRVEAGDRGAVEAHPPVERVVQLLLGDGEALELTEDVREPQPDELDVALLDRRHHIVFRHHPSLRVGKPAAQPPRARTGPPPRARG